MKPPHEVKLDMTHPDAYPMYVCYTCRDTCFRWTDEPIEIFKQRLIEFMKLHGVIEESNAKTDGT